MTLKKLGCFIWKSSRRKKIDFLSDKCAYWSNLMTFRRMFVDNDEINGYTQINRFLEMKEIVFIKFSILFWIV